VDTTGNSYYAGEYFRDTRIQGRILQRNSDTAFFLPFDDYYRETLILGVDTTEKLFFCGWILRETLITGVDTTEKLVIYGGYYRETFILHVDNSD